MKGILFLCFCFNCLYSLAQVDVYNEFVKQQESTRESPTVASLSKFTKWPINYSTGTVNIEIPIYKIKYGSIEIPISLKYHGSGVKINEPSGVVGLGWTLVGSGNISRQINGLDDFLENSGFAGSFVNPDFSNLNLSANTIDDVVNNVITSNSSNPSYLNNFGGRITQGCIDGEADDYYINAPGLSGKINFNQKRRKFELDEINDFEVIVNSNNNERIDLPNIWIIKNNTGLEYHFALKEIIDNPFYYSGWGGYNPRYCQEPVPPLTITKAWHLSSIKDTRINKEVNFHYYNEYTIQHNGIDIDRTYDSYGNLSSHSVYENLRKGYEHIIKYIDFGEGIIYFDREIGSGTDGGVNPITSIRVIDKFGNLVKHVLLQYEIIQSSLNNFSINNQYKDEVDASILASKFAQRRYLVEVKEKIPGNSSENSLFKIEYNNRELLPPRFSYSQDHWGYFNGANNPSLLPYSVLNELNTSDKNILGANREVNIQTSSFGMIKSITYPTRGKTLFFFENNKHHDGNSEYFTGGMRIKGINYFDQITGKSVVNDYVYNASVLYDVPKYYYEFQKVNSQGFSSAQRKVHSNSSSPNQQFFGSHILYYKVTEDMLSSGSERLRTIFSFNNPFDEAVVSNFSSGLGVPFNKRPVFSKYSGLPSGIEYYNFINGEYRLTKKIEKEYEALNGWNDYSWNIQSSWALIGEWVVDPDHDPFTTVPLTYYSSVNCYRGIRDKAVLKRELEVHYRDDNSISSSFLKEFEYNKSNGYLKKEWQNDSKGNTVINEYTYAIDFPFGTGISLFSGDLMQILKKKRNNINGETYIIDGLLNYYSNEKMEKQFVLKIKQPILEGDFLFPNTITGALTFDSRFSEEKLFQNFNSNNLPGFIKDKHFYSSFLWEPNSMNLIGEAKQAYFNDFAYTSFENNFYGNWNINGNLIKTDGGFNGTNSLLVNGTILKSNLDFGKKYYLRFWIHNSGNFVNLNGCSIESGYPKILNSNSGWSLIEYKLFNVTELSILASDVEIDDLLLFSEGSIPVTYSHKPLIGLVSRTDANGKYSNFDYDINGRLLQVRDNEGNVLKRYCYNYAGQPISCGPQTFLSYAYSANFTRTNCGVGFIGGSVPFAAPQGMFSSNINQWDANQQAINYVNQNGQANANSLGSCTPVGQSGPCEFHPDNSISIPSYSFYSDGSSTSGYMVVFLPNGFTSGSTISLGSFDSGGCKPSSDRTQTFNSGGNIFIVTFYAYGGIDIRLENSYPSMPSGSTIILNDILFDQ